MEGLEFQPLNLRNVHRNAQPSRCCSAMDCAARIGDEVCRSAKKVERSGTSTASRLSERIPGKDVIVELEDKAASPRHLAGDPA